MSGERRGVVDDGSPTGAKLACERCGSGEWTWSDLRGCSDCLGTDNMNESVDVLGFCPHGVNLDREFCPKGCRV